MQVLIPTYGRAQPHLQATLRQLVDDGVTVSLLVQDREHEQYMRKVQHHVIVLPDRVRDVSATRDFVIHEMEGEDHVLMLDDDLHFAVRREDNPTKFRQPFSGNLEAMVAEIDRKLREFPMVGIGAREGGNRNIEPFMYNTRIMRVMGFRRSYLREKGITFAPMQLMEDFHVALQVLRSGADICLCNRWVSNQAGGSNAPGGCSTYRTEALQTASAHALAARHPGFVRVVQKATKTAWGGGVRTDVTVQWKAARRSAG
jgi:hypothetical protein